MEEVFFRGILLPGLAGRYGFAWANFITAFLFGFGHGGIPGVLFATIFGLLMGQLSRQTGSILPCIGVHAANNFLFLVEPTWLRYG